MLPAGPEPGLASRQSSLSSGVLLSDPFDAGPSVVFSSDPLAVAVLGVPLPQVLLLLLWLVLVCLRWLSCLTGGVNDPPFAVPPLPPPPLLLLHAKDALQADRFGSPTELEKDGKQAQIKLQQNYAWTPP